VDIADVAGSARKAFGRPFCSAGATLHSFVRLQALCADSTIALRAFFPVLNKL